MTREQQTVMKNLAGLLPVTALLGLFTYGAAIGPTGHWIAATLFGLVFVPCLVFCMIGIHVFFTPSDADQGNQK